MRPYVVEKIVHSDGREEIVEPQITRQVISEQTANKLTAMLVNTVRNGYDKVKIKGYFIAGKTGTAQVVEMKGGYVKSEQLSHFARDHAWFVSYAPVQSPQVAIAVLVEHGGHGGDAAAPMAKKVYEKFIELQKQAAEKQHVQAPGANHAD